VHLHLSGLLEEPLPLGTKGLPPAAAGLTLEAIGKQGWNLLRGDVPLPAAVLKQEALEHNLRVMERFTAAARVRMAPHGKTTMAPQLFQMQLAHGAWALTAATIAHVALYRRFGVSRILFANQLIDPLAIEYVLDELERDPGFEFYSVVDSHEAAGRLAAAHGRRRGLRPIQVLIEAGAASGRTGLRTARGILELGRYIKATGALQLRGVEAFEGIFSLSSDPDALHKVRALLATMRECLTELARLDLLAPGRSLVSAGGSAYFEAVVHELQGLPDHVDVVLRSGCYLVHDHGMYAQALGDPAHLPASARCLSQPLTPALEVWGYVQSRPERGLAIASCGKRDLSYDAGLPVATSWFRPGVHSQPQAFSGEAGVAALNDQHAYLEVDPGHALQTGDLVSFGISHPCTTFDKWQLLYLVNAGYDVIGGIRTFF
jgi:D-serine dehydratase